MNFDIHKPQTKIIIIAGAALLAGVFALFIWGGREETGKTGNSGSAPLAQTPGTRLRERLLSEPALDIIHEREKAAGIPTETTGTNSVEEPNAFRPEGEEPLQENTPPKNTQPSGNEPVPDPLAAPSLITHKEVFTALNPPVVTSILSGLEKKLMELDILPDAPATTLDSDQAITGLMLRTVQALEQKGIFPKNDAAQIQKALLEDWPKTRQLEYDITKMIMERARKSTEFDATPQWKLSAIEFVNRASRFGLPAAITTALGYLSPNIAQADHGGWHTTPDCYKDEDPENSEEGINLFAICCNCGLFCAYSCTFYYDCGENSQQCNVPLGCLNLIGFISPNAVWDGPPGAIFPITFICGIDFPGGGAGK